MRSTILATLVFVPALLHAQTSKASGNLQASANAPYTLASEIAPANTTSVKVPMRISTGVIQPTLVDQPTISYTDRELGLNRGDNSVIVGMLVDEKGNTQEVEIVKSLNKTIDERVVAALRQSHFRPATLDAQAIPVHVNLSILLQR